MLDESTESVPLLTIYNVLAKDGVDTELQYPSGPWYTHKLHRLSATASMTGLRMNLTSLINGSRSHCGRRQRVLSVLVSKASLCAYFRKILLITLANYGMFFPA